MPRIVLAVLRNSVLRVQVFACPVLNCWPPPPPVDIKVALQDALHGYCRYNVFLCYSICSVTYSCLTALVSNAPGDDEERYLCQMAFMHLMPLLTPHCRSSATAPLLRSMPWRLCAPRMPR